MNDFFDKWKSDSKYRAKIKLIGYALFVAIVAIYALTIDTTPNTNIQEKNNVGNELDKEKDIIKIPETYNYEINININDEIYKYTGKKEINQTTITKIIKDSTTNYILKDNEYYVEDNNTYIKTTKEEVYDIINYNYINIDTINTYLKKSNKDSNQYTVYLKDVILGNDSEDYFIININDNNINIDYTVLMKQFNSDIVKYNVNIKIEEAE